MLISTQVDCRRLNVAVGSMLHSEHVFLTLGTMLMCVAHLCCDGAGV